MDQLKVGFGRTNITPPMDISIGGYYIPRYADGVLDELEANAMAVAYGDTRAVLIAIDHLGLNSWLCDRFRDALVEGTGLPRECIFLSCTHTHTAPFFEDYIDFFDDPEHEELNRAHTAYACRKIVDAARFALADLSPAKMGYGIGQAPNVAFVRRFRMKDGSLRTNPGVNNPDILHPIGEVDERVSVVRFDREGKDTVLFVNFANHPDVVGGNKISADWPGLTRATVEKALDNVKCLVFNGCQGDVNHVNVHPKKGDFNDMFMDFDDVSRGYGHARYIARVITGGVLQTFDKVEYVDVDKLACREIVIKLPSQMPDKKDLPEAHRINDLHNAGRDDEIGLEGMLLTTAVAEAGRMVRLENGPEFFTLTLSGIALGPVAFIGIAGEPFNAIGRAIKDTEGYGLIIPTCCTNGYEGYFPTQEAYDEGGYEAKSSPFASGVAERLISAAKEMLKEME